MVFHALEKKITAFTQQGTNCIFWNGEESKSGARICPESRKLEEMNGLFLKTYSQGLFRKKNIDIY